MNNIQNSKSSTITFKSNIKIVSPKFFQQQTRKMFRNPECEIIGNFDIIPSILQKDFYAYRKDLALGFTQRVRTCTAGVIANKGQNASLFMHILNSKENKKSLDILTDGFHGTNAILIGSKNGFSYSNDIFDKLKRYAKNKNLPVTILKGLATNWEANLAYIAKEDTLYLSVNKITNKSEYVNSIKKLKEVFKKVEISPNDSVEIFGDLKQTKERAKQFITFVEKITSICYNRLEKIKKLFS